MIYYFNEEQGPLRPCSMDDIARRDESSTKAPVSYHIFQTHLSHIVNKSDKTYTARVAKKSSKAHDPGIACVDNHE